MFATAAKFKLLNTSDIAEMFKYKFLNEDFRIIGNDVQQSKTIEIQGAHFEVDKPWILREPNYDYFNRELEWYKTQSLNVNDIPGGAPKMWKACSTPDGFINSNYGWCIGSEENGKQFEHCLNMLVKDPHTREACMIYTRPSIQDEYCKDGMHDFICTMSTHLFLNEHNDGNIYLCYQVFQRSCDAIFGFDNDVLWHIEVQKEMCRLLSNVLNTVIYPEKIIYNCASLHVYERHFKYLEN